MVDGWRTLERKVRNWGLAGYLGVGLVGWSDDSLSARAFTWKELCGGYKKPLEEAYIVQ